MIFAMDQGLVTHIVAMIALVGLRVASAGFHPEEETRRIINDYMDGRLDVLVLSYKHCFGTLQK